MFRLVPGRPLCSVGAMRLGDESESEIVSRFKKWAIHPHIKFPRPSPKALTHVLKQFVKYFEYFYCDDVFKIEYAYRLLIHW